LVPEGRVRGGGCRQSKEAVSEGGGGGAVASTAKATKKKKKKQSPAGDGGGGGGGGSSGGATPATNAKKKPKPKPKPKKPKKPKAPPAAVTFSPEVEREIEERLAKANTADDGGKTWPAWRADAMMIELPDGTEFDTNSTAGVLEMLRREGPLLGDAVCRAIFRILGQTDELDDQRLYIEEHAGAAPPSVVAEAQSGGFDAFGVVALKCVDLEQQLKELDAKPSIFSFEKNNFRKPLGAALKEQRAQLATGYAMIASWGLAVDPAVVQTPLAAFEALPIAAKEGKTTMQTVIGTATLQSP
jgi:hypothetical protein